MNYHNVLAKHPEFSNFLMRISGLAVLNDEEIDKLGCVNIYSHFFLGGSLVTDHA